MLAARRSQYSHLTINLTIKITSSARSHRASGRQRAAGTAHSNKDIGKRAARPSGRARRGAGAGCSAIKYQSLLQGEIESGQMHGFGTIVYGDADSRLRFAGLSLSLLITRKPDTKVYEP